MIYGAKETVEQNEIYGKVHTVSLWRRTDQLPASAIKHES
jgi:hypothetical protein